MYHVEERLQDENLGITGSYPLLQQAEQYVKEQMATPFGGSTMYTIYRDTPWLGLAQNGQQLEEVSVNLKPVKKKSPHPKKGKIPTGDIDSLPAARPGSIPGSIKAALREHLRVETIYCHGPIGNPYVVTRILWDDEEISADTHPLMR